MGKSIMLDESKPYGKVLGDDNVFFKQGGADFDSLKRLIPGSKNSGPALISEHIEEIATAKPVYTDMHIHALKRHLKERYAELEEAGVEFEKVAMGEGAQARIIAFLEAN